MTNGNGGKEEDGNPPHGVCMETPPSGFTCRQWTHLLFFGTIGFLASMTISLHSPFYPIEAERRGATAFEYGIVFGIFEFVVFLLAPVYGKYMNRIGPLKVFISSILVNSLAVFSFGILHWISDHTWFIGLSFVARIFEGLGSAGIFTATFVLIACEFPQSIATTFASLETFIGLGFIVGPTVGEALYSFGGFPLPFFVIGTCLAITAIPTFLLIPPSDKANTPDGFEQQGYGVWTVLKIPSVALASLSIVTTAISLGFVSATLEPHIRRFGLTPLETGLVFIVNGGMYALTGPIWGMICDRIERPAYITILGNLLICISFVFIGPAIFVPFDTILWVTIIGLLIQGLGLGCCFVSTFIVGIQDSLKHGFPDNLATYAVVSGLWQSMISLGVWIGPSIGGLLYDTVGFREGSWLVLVASFFAGMAIVVYFCVATDSSLLSQKDSRREEFKPLLRKPSLLNPFGGKGYLEESCVVGPSSIKSTSSSYGTT